MALFKKQIKQKPKDQISTSAKTSRSEPTLHDIVSERDVVDDETIFDSNPSQRKSAVSQTPQRMRDDLTSVHGIAEAGIARKAVESTPKNWEAAEKKLREQLHRIRESLAEMTAQTRIQKNVSNVLTQGMLQINEAVDIAIQELKRLKKIRNKEETKRTRSVEGLKKTPLQKCKGVAHIPSPDHVPIVQKRDEIGNWAVVTSRRKRATNGGQPMGVPRGIEPVVRGSVRPNPRPKRGAVLVKPAEGKTYAEIVRSMKTKMKGSHFKEKVHAIRKTKDGAVLVQLEKEEDRSEFQKALQNVIGQTGRVKDLTSKVTLEFLDLDSETTAVEVADGINNVLGGHAHRNVHVFGENARGQTLAVCEFDGNEATKLLEKSRIRIGWVNCRVRQRIRVKRCYRCLGYGHLKADCKGPDRRDCCWRCGKKGHVGKDCKNPPACFICTDTDNRHLPGTGSCAAFRAALAEMKKNRPKCP